MIYEKSRIERVVEDRFFIIHVERGEVVLFEGEPNIRKLELRSRLNPDIEYYTVKFVNGITPSVCIEAIKKRPSLLKESELIKRI